MNDARSHGFTLLEVLLALALTALILVALSMVIDFHFRVLDTGRAHVEEAQLARVLLRRIADDLRSAVTANSQSSASGATSTSPGSSPTTSGDTSGTGGAATATGSSGSASGTSASGTGTDSSLSSVVHAAPGIFGDAYSIQVDVSRLPQPQQLQMQSQTTSEGQPASLGDVKTVYYYASGAQGSGSSGLPVTSSDQQRGLVRCEMDRAVSSYKSEQGGLASTDFNPVLLAPEVAGLEFAYTDGTQWLDSWDSTANGGLPMAVRVTLHITASKSKRNSSQGSTGLASGSATSENTLPYTLLVSIPIAQPAQASSTSTTPETGTGGSE